MPETMAGNLVMISQYIVNSRLMRCHLITDNKKSRARFITLQCRYNIPGVLAWSIIKSKCYHRFSRVNSVWIFSLRFCTLFFICILFRGIRCCAIPGSGYLNLCRTGFSTLQHTSGQQQSNYYTQCNYGYISFLHNLVLSFFCRSCFHKLFYHTTLV